MGSLLKVITDEKSGDDLHLYEFKSTITGYFETDIEHEIIVRGTKEQQEKIREQYGKALSHHKASDATMFRGFLERFKQRSEDRFGVDDIDAFDERDTYQLRTVIEIEEWPTDEHKYGLGLGGWVDSLKVPLEKICVEHAPVEDSVAFDCIYSYRVYV